MISLSSNQYSHDLQVKDAVEFIRDAITDQTVWPDFQRTFPEWDDLVWEGAHVDTEASGVDVEYTSWITEWIEDHTDVMWYEGEPVIFENDDELDPQDDF